MCNNVHYTWRVSLKDSEKEILKDHIKYSLDHTLDDKDLLRQINIEIIENEHFFSVKGICTNNKGELLNTFIYNLNTHSSSHRPEPQ